MRRRHRHQVQSTKEVREDWIEPIREVRRFPNVVADRAYELIRGANRKKMLSTIRKKSQRTREDHWQSGEVRLPEDLWAIAAVEVMSEMEGCDYGTDKIFLELKIPERQELGRQIPAPEKGASAMGAEDTRREVLRNTLERSRQIRNCLMPQRPTSETIPPELCSEVMDIACNLLRDEWMQPLHEGDFYGIHPFSSHPLGGGVQSGAGGYETSGKLREKGQDCVLGGLPLQGDNSRLDKVGNSSSYSPEKIWNR